MRILHPVGQYRLTLSAEPSLKLKRTHFCVVDFVAASTILALKTIVKPEYKRHNFIKDETWTTMPKTGFEW